MKKGIALCLEVFLSLIISFTLVSALGSQSVCLNKGEKIYFSDCNPEMPDYTCTENKCTLCVNEIRTGVYCTAGNPDGCEGICEYLYDEPEPPEINPPVEDSSIVVLINPVNNYILSAPGQVTFSFKVVQKLQRYRFAICELVIDGDVKISKSLPQWSTSYPLKASLTNGSHTWRMYCTEAESDGGDVFMSELRSISVGSIQGAVCGNNIKEGTEQCDDGNTANGDGCSSLCEIEQEQQTEISLVNPANAYTSTDTQTIDFTFSIPSSVLSNIISCNLVLNDAVVETITEITSENIIPYSVSPAGYTWRIDCLDDLDQTTSSISRTFIINSPAPAGNPGGSGGGGGGGGSGIPTYTLTQEQLNNGTTQSLQKSARFKFKVLNEDHYVTVDEIATIYIQLTVSSEPQKFLLYVANEKKVDVNNDKVYDILLTLNKIENNKAEITIKSISEPIPEGTLDNAENSNPTGTETTTSQTPQGKLAGITGAAIGGIKTNKIPIALGFVIIVAIAGLFVYNHKKKKEGKD